MAVRPMRSKLKIMSKTCARRSRSRARRRFVDGTSAFHDDGEKLRATAVRADRADTTAADAKARRRDDGRVAHQTLLFVEASVSPSRRGGMSFLTRSIVSMISLIVAA